MLRKDATPVLEKYWKSIEIFDRKYAETGDFNYLNQKLGLIKQSLEIMNRVTNEESNRENRRRDGEDRRDGLSQW